MTFVTQAPTTTKCCYGFQSPDLILFFQTSLLTLAMAKEGNYYAFKIFAIC